MQLLYAHNAYSHAHTCMQMEGMQLLYAHNTYSHAQTCMQMEEAAARIKAEEEARSRKEAQEKMEQEVIYVYICACIH
jgi:hypothetical protein